jgi:hypothetical protein
MPTHSLKLLLTTVAAIVAMGLAAPTAPAAGGPPIGYGAWQGVVSPGGDTRYVTMSFGRNTILARIGVDGGTLRTYRSLRGFAAIPAVAYDGTAGGLSADGSRLVLMRPKARFPSSPTRFLVLDPRRMRLLEPVRLRGAFAFDAVSPDGRWLYLVEYLSPPRIDRYRVRAYDLQVGKLAAEPVLDPAAASAAMRGIPITRTMSPDGRWAYTLYNGGGKEPFVHALDTERRRAVCIDLPSLEGYRGLFALGMTVNPAGTTLNVVRDGRGRGRATPVAVIDTKTFEVSDPLRKAEPTDEDAGGGVPWLLLPVLAIGGIAAALLTAGWRGRRRGGDLPPDPWTPGEPAEEHREAERQHSGVR